MRSAVMLRPFLLRFRGAGSVGLRRNAAYRGSFADRQASQRTIGLVMTIGRSLVIAAVLLAGTTLTAGAQSTYPYYSSFYPYYTPDPYGRGPLAPPSWSYDPYTSGLTSCPQRYRNEPPCRVTMHPTYGQPSYWAR